MSFPAAGSGFQGLLITSILFKIVIYRVNQAGLSAARRHDLRWSVTNGSAERPLLIYNYAAAQIFDKSVKLRCSIPHKFHGGKNIINIFLQLVYSTNTNSKWSFWPSRFRRSFVMLIPGHLEPYSPIYLYQKNVK